MTIHNEEVYSAIPKKAGKQQKSTTDKSLVNKEITHSNGDLGGKSRGAGDVDEDTRRKIIDMIIDESVRRGFSYHDIAYFLAIVRLESGFNPDAANGGSSSGGIGQINNNTALDVKEYTNKPAWIKANPLYKNVDVSNPADRFNARKSIIATIIIYERCKAKAMRRAGECKVAKYDEFIYQYFHGGLYFDALVVERIPRVKKDFNKIDPGIVDKYAFGIYKNELENLINKIENSLKNSGAAMLQFNHADGKPAAGQKVAIIVPKSITVRVKELYDKWFGSGAQSTQAASSNAGATDAAKTVHAQQKNATASGMVTASPSISPHPIAPVPTASATTPIQTSAPLPPKKILLPPKVGEKEDSELQVLLLTTNADGSLPIELPIGTGVVNVCLLGKHYEKRAVDLLKQREEAQEESSEPVGKSAQNAEIDVDTESEVTPLGLYCNREPNEADLARAFAKIGLAYIPELIGFKRSFVLKSPAVIDAVLAVEPKPADDAVQAGTGAPTPAPAKPEEHVIVSNQPKPTNQPLAKVTTDSQTASASAIAPRATPWMDIALSEYKKKVQRIDGEEDKHFIADIKKIIGENKKVKTRLNDAIKKSKGNAADADVVRFKKELAVGNEKLKAAVEEMRKAQNDPKINNPQIIAYIATTQTGKELMASNTPIEDSIAWCASFVNWCLLNSTPVQPALNSARAIDWATYGESVPIGTPGAITVVKQGSGSHVGFFLSFYKGKKKFIMLGGNQTYDVEHRSDPRVSRITQSNFDVSCVVATRMPVNKG